MKKKHVSEISKTIGRNMKQIIKAAGYTQAEAAASIGIMTPSTFAHYLIGLVEVPIDKLYKFMRKFGVSFEELTGNLPLEVHAGESEKLYIIAEAIETTLQQTRQRLTPSGFAKLMKLVACNYKDAKDFEGTVKDILKQARILSPEIFASSGINNEKK
jgi:transcriptional regulator with XRE-family HTH domain